MIAQPCPPGLWMCSSQISLILWLSMNSEKLGEVTHCWLVTTVTALCSVNVTFIPSWVTSSCFSHLLSLHPSSSFLSLSSLPLPFLSPCPPLLPFQYPFPLPFSHHLSLPGYLLWQLYHPDSQPEVKEQVQGAACGADAQQRRRGCHCRKWHDSFAFCSSGE